jgi:16S rRNA (uracil1498-N3)-methyltransferase
MNRFFIPPDWIVHGTVSLKGDVAHQVAAVLRMKAKDHIIVLDNSGMEYEVAIEQVSNNLVRARVISQNICHGEPDITITLYQALLKADKFELVLQKGVELGISAFVPVISERCVAKAPSAARVRRWQSIIREAAELTGRAVLPVLKPVASFTDACATTQKPAILFWEEEGKSTLRTALRKISLQQTRGMGIFIGPEGGFPASEVAFAESNGITPVSLGQRVLRAETASVAAVSIILYERGELG